MNVSAHWLFGAAMMKWTESKAPAIALRVGFRFAVTALCLPEVQTHPLPAFLDLPVHHLPAIHVHCLPCNLRRPS